MNLYPKLQETVDSLSLTGIPHERKEVLQGLISYIVERIREEGGVNLNFICTHNSRRSHLGMIWGQTAAVIHNINTNCHSGGTDATEFFHRSVSALRTSGFHIEIEGNKNVENPTYLVQAFQEGNPLKCFSKTYKHPESPRKNFAAVVVCDNADKCCPQIFEGLKIPVKYVDPKVADSWDCSEDKKVAHYKERSDQIGSEMLYVFSEAAKILSQK